MVRPEVKRKLIHGLFGLSAFLMNFLTRWQSLAVVIFFLALTVFVFKPNRWKGAFEAMSRDLDRKTGYLVGPLLYIISTFIVVLLFDLRVAGVAMVMMAWGDSAATIVGINYGKTKLPKPLSREKSLQGSLGFFTLALLGGLAAFYTISFKWAFGGHTYPMDFRWLTQIPNKIFANVVLVTIIITSIAETIIEATDLKINDNVSVPLTSAIIMTTLLRWWG